MVKGVEWKGLIVEDRSVTVKGVVGGWVNQAYSRLSTTHGHITDCKLDSVVYAGVSKEWNGKG